MSTPTIMLHTALAYAVRGWPVLPIEPRGKNSLSRLVRHGVKQATTDSAVLREWFTKQPDANLGVACKTVLTVHDVDIRNGGDAELERLHGLRGPLPLTPWQRTGSGGSHFVFQNPGGNLRGKVGPGLDLLHGDKYFLVSPSVHPCGEIVHAQSEPRSFLAVVVRGTFVTLNLANGKTETWVADPRRSTLTATKPFRTRFRWGWWVMNAHSSPMK